MAEIRDAALKIKLDFLDYEIYKLEREKTDAGDDDLPLDIEEAKQIQQAARESYSRGELQKSWLQATRAECCLFLGQKDLESWHSLVSEIGRALGQY